VVPEHERGDLLDRLTRAHARSLVLAQGLGRWDVARQVSENAKMVAYVVRYSNGAASWDEVEALGLTTMHRRAADLGHWIKIENGPTK